MSINTKINVADGFTRPLTSMLESINRTIQSFNNLKNVSETAVNTQNITKASNDMGEMVKNIDTATNEVTTMSREQMKMAQNVEDTTNRAKGLNTETSRTGKTIKQNEQEQQKFNQQLRGAEDLAEKVGNKIKSWLAGYAVFNMFRQGFEVFAGFEQSMANLQATTMATGDAFEALKHQAKIMGETTVFTAGESADAMNELAKGGLQVVDVIQGVEHVLNLAGASGMGLAESAGIMVDIMTGFGLAGQDLGRVADLITFTASNASTSVGLMGETFAYAASVAKTFNASLEETSALIGLMSASAKGSRAGTALRSGFGRMADLTSEGQQWADALQVSFIDPTTNNLRSVTNIVDDLAVAFTRLTDAQQIQASKAIFGEEAYGAWLAVIQAGQGAMGEWLEDFENSAVGTAEKMKEIMLNTTQGILRIHQSEVESIWINFYEGLSTGVVKDAFIGILTMLRQTLETALTIATLVFTVVGLGINFVIENIEILLPLMITTIIVWALLNAEIITNTIVTGIAMAKQVLYHIQVVAVTISLMLQAVATFILTLATQGLNAAMSSTPLAWVAAGIVIIIGLIFAAVAAYNKWAEKSVSAMGIIVGSIAVGLAIIANLFIAVANFVIGLGIGIYNRIIGFAEFLANVFNDPVTAIAQLFEDMAQHTLQTLETLARAIDDIFGSNLASVVRGWQDNLAKWVTDKFGENEIQFERKDIKDFTFDRFDYGDAWDAGYKLGEKAEQKFKDMFSFDTPEFDMDKFMKDNMPDLPELDPSGVTDMLGDIADSAADTAKNAKGIKDKLDATEEDLKYLRDLAMTRILNRYTNADINVVIQNENNISNDMDLDGVLNTLTTGIEETLQVSMEGL